VLNGWQVRDATTRYHQDANAIDRIEEELQEQLRMRDVHLQERRRFNILVWRCTQVGTVGTQRWDCIYHVSPTVLILGGFVRANPANRYEKSMEAMDRFDPERKYL
jgi:hypothetical protein